jgi:hypothetical protein
VIKVHIHQAQSARYHLSSQITIDDTKNLEVAARTFNKLVWTPGVDAVSISVNLCQTARNTGPYSITLLALVAFQLFLSEIGSLDENSYRCH